MAVWPDYEGEKSVCGWLEPSETCGTKYGYTRAIPHQKLVENTKLLGISFRFLMVLNHEWRREMMLKVFLAAEYCYYKAS